MRSAAWLRALVTLAMGLAAANAGLGAAGLGAGGLGAGGAGTGSHRLVIAWTGGAARAEGVTHRFALLAGNARGGPGTRPLLYAADDARKLLDILTRLGSVSADDTILLLDGDAGGFSAALDALEGRARQASARGEKTSLVVYYSGHARGGSLRLGESELHFEALRPEKVNIPTI
ncbi:MAG: hypothetical protein ABI560_09390, partial [Myxococcales bacterium]